jgi:dolichol-phosphate mannosyltransferase
LIPTYNEALTIERQLRALERFRADQDPDKQFDVLVIDDNSPDGTADIVRSLGFAWVQLLLPAATPRSALGKKTGLGNAYKRGFAWAIERGYGFVVEMDADGSHKVEDLHKLLDADPTADLVIGSRWIRGGSIENWSWGRKVISRSGNFYSRIVLRFPIKDSTSGYRRISTLFLGRIDMEKIDSAGYGFQIEMAYTIHAMGGVVVEVPICFAERIAGYSKMTTDIAREAFFNITRIAFHK